MPFLSPAKLLVILVVALVVLGPDKLPRVAQQIGGLWGDFRKFREKLESEVRDNFPDLPSTDAITQVVRSPLSFLDNLAEAHGPQDGMISETVEGAELHAPAGATIGASGTNRPGGTVKADEESPSMAGLPGTDPGRGSQNRSSGGAVAYGPEMN